MANYRMPLAMVPPGEAVTVAYVQAGCGLSRRLADMGLTPGTVLKVIRGDGAGPILIDIRGSRLMLGVGVAHRVMVEKAGG
jgi:ferrous iron transport protein A